jgi:hypothetical protein
MVVEVVVDNRLDHKDKKVDKVDSHYKGEIAVDKMGTDKKVVVVEIDMVRVDMVWKEG